MKLVRYKLYIGKSLYAWGPMHYMLERIEELDRRGIKEYSVVLDKEDAKNENE